MAFSSISQEVKKNKDIIMSTYLGESTGISIGKKISPNFSLQLNVGVNELFLDYNFLDKYVPYRINQSYGTIYSTSLGLAYVKRIKSDSPFSFRASIGAELRITSKYNSQPNTEELPPELIIIDDPVSKTKKDFGINYFIGLGYDFNKRFGLFADIGGYSEITGTFLWTNPQFRIGMQYTLRRKGK